MRKLLLALVLPVLAILPALSELARGQGQISPEILYVRQRQFFIPFKPDAGEAHRLKQLQLYYSNDLGRSWHLGATAAPDQEKFNFLAPADGLYLLAVQTTDQAGRAFPEKMDGVTAGMRVVVDTVPPVITLKALPARGGEVGVAWTILDDNPDLTPGGIELSYRVAGGMQWQPLYRQLGAAQHYWAPGTSASLEVKLRARDLAGNVAEATTQVSLAGGGFNDPGPQPGPAALDPDRRFISTKRISLNYKITEQGPSGISGLDLWFTTDGRSWSKYQLPKNAVSDVTFTGPLVFDVQNEGVYGFTLVPKSGVGISAPPPQIGEKPQIWIEVDTTKPVVELQSVLVGQGQNKGKLQISWLARDKNFGKTPITLSYATTTTGPWTTCGKDLPNSGNYVWTMPTGGDMPWQFYLKVEAVDLAGNVGEAVTPGLVKVDTVPPRAVITGVQPGG